MKSINKYVLMIAISLSIATNSCMAQLKNAKTETVKVEGNCNMCQKNIETAAFKKKTSNAKWDSDKKTAVLIYDSIKTTSDAILKNIALAGYDNEKYMAPDKAYANLDGCCQYDRKKLSQQTKQPVGKAEITMNHNLTSMNTKDTVSKSETKETENPFATIYNCYFGLKDALAKDDGTMASAKAKELSVAIAAMPMEKLSTEQHLVWMKALSKLSADSKTIGTISNIDKQRESFISLSDSMFEIFKVAKPDYTAYYHYCPMKNAYWLSKEKEIKNPYYGSQMLTCGSTKETITK